MKILVAMAMFGLGVTAAQAGSQPVVTPVIDFPTTYYIYTIQTTATPQVPTQGASAVSASPRAPVTQTGYGVGTQDDIYARLLKEAQKRGLR